jgi:hypothetical protein
VIRSTTTGHSSTGAQTFRTPYFCGYRFWSDYFKVGNNDHAGSRES